MEIFLIILLVVIFVAGGLFTLKDGKKRCQNCNFHGKTKEADCPQCGEPFDDVRRVFRRGSGGNYT